MYDNDGLNKIQKSLDATGVLSEGYKARLMAHAIEAVNVARVEGMKEGRATQPEKVEPETQNGEKAIYTDGLNDLVKDAQKAWSIIKTVLKD